MLAFLDERDPFQNSDTLHNIFTGIVDQTTVPLTEGDWFSLNSQSPLEQE